MDSRAQMWPERDIPGSSLGKKLFVFAALLLPVIVVVLVTYRSALVENRLISGSLKHEADAIALGLATSLNVGAMHSVWTSEAVQDLLDANAAETGALLIIISSPQGLLGASASRLTPGDLPEGLLSSPYDRVVPSEGLFIKKHGLFVYQKPIKDLSESIEKWSLTDRSARMHNLDSLVPADSRITVVLDASASYYLRSRHLRMNLAMGLLLMVTIAGIAGWGFWSQKARKAATALARAESYARQIMARMPAGLILCDHEGKVVMTNAGAADILGIPENRLRGRQIGEIFPDRILPIDSLGEVSDHPVTEGVMEMAGRRLSINLSAAIVPGGDGEPGRTLILFQDTTEIETLREQLSRSERLAEIGKLSSTIAHEIRNPLSSIRGLVQLLSGKVPEKQRAMMKVVLREVDRLNRVVSGLLSYARQENPDLKEWKIKDILEHVKVLATGDARLREVSVQIDLAEEDLSWPFDRDMMVQALLNLVMNAIEASGPRQTVRLSAQVDEGALLLAVDDQGTGIPEESEKLFALFETTKEKGTGLGLAMVRKVAQLHGGRATLSLNRDGGTRAAIEIPRGRRTWETTKMG